MNSLLSHFRFIFFYLKIGPDMYLTHWILFFKPLAELYCNWLKKSANKDYEKDEAIIL